jgi:hypothetical protein
MVTVERAFSTPPTGGLTVPLRTSFVNVVVIVVVGLVVVATARTVAVVGAWAHDVPAMFISRQCVRRSKSACGNTIARPSINST